MTEKKITDNELRKELQKGKTIREISEEYGYNNRRTLSDRLRGANSYPGVDFKVLNKFTRTGEGGTARIVSVTEKEIERAGFDPEDELYFDKEVMGGKIILKISHERVIDREK